MEINVANINKREFELIASDLNNDPCIFPRDTSNHVFVQAFDFKTKLIAKSPTNYLAFPYVVSLSSSLIGIYSDGDAHASSDKQVMIRSDDNGLTWTSTNFYIASTDTYDFSLLQGVLSADEKVVLKVWTVTNVDGTTLSATNVQTSVTSGTDIYTLWSRPVRGTNNILYRTGYTTTSWTTEVSSTKTGLLTSIDGDSWNLASVMFLSAGLMFTEADIVNISNNNWFAVVREQSGSFNPLWWTTSNDNGATWMQITSANLFDITKINGRQPNLIKTLSGGLILSTGDRAGGSSYTGEGSQLPFLGDTTGITVYRAPELSAGNDPLAAPTIGQSKMRLALTDHGLETGNIICIQRATATGGIPASEINTFKTIQKISDNVIEFDVTSNATDTNTGGGSSVKLQLINPWGFRTRISPMFSTDGGQPFANEISPNRINVVYYARRSNRSKPVIASAFLDIDNL